jgi:hypothetical protein
VPIAIILIAAFNVGAEQRLSDTYYYIPETTPKEPGWSELRRFLIRPELTPAKAYQLGAYPNWGVNTYINYGDAQYQKETWGGVTNVLSWFFRGRLQYDALGRMVANGSPVFRWEEFRPLSAQQRGSILRKFPWFNSVGFKLVIARDDYSDWSTRLTVAENLQTSFTPLTLDMARLNGLRWDLAYRRNHLLTMAVSKVSDPIIVRATTIDILQRTQYEESGTFLVGTHWRGNFLDAIRVGLTEVNLHRYDAKRQRGDFWRGIAPVEFLPDTVIVRFADDSPGDGRGAVVFDIKAVVTVNDRERHETITDILPVVVTSPGATRGADRWEVTGNDFVEYRFPVPRNAYRAAFEATVADDYRISVRQRHSYTTKREGQSALQETSGYTILRAEGNVRTLSNKRKVTFSYGLPTGLNVYGANAELTLVGAWIKAEIARSSAHFQYPTFLREASRSLLTDLAGYVQVTKDIGDVTLGGEYFSIGPKYTSYEENKSTYRNNFLGFDYNGVNTRGQQIEGRQDIMSPGPLRGVVHYALVDDNDDDDQYPDNMVDDSPSVGNPVQAIEAGVYPGFDVDKDGVPDNNRNNNNIPDYLEPFFKYWADPDELYWGDDANNNGVLDSFEDDPLPDYPYYKDERGPHLFASWRTPLHGLNTAVGGYDVRQIAGGGQNRVLYTKLSYRRESPGRWGIDLFHETKRVEDDIPNPVFRYRVTPSPARTIYESVFVDDGRTMRKSLVQRGFLGTTVHPIRGLNVAVNVRYEINAQLATTFDDGSSQPSDRIDMVGVVGRLDHTKAFGNLTVTPMIKYLFLKKNRRVVGPTLLEHFSTLTPILKVGYLLTPRTSLHVGAEGFPFLKDRLWDHTGGNQGFRETIYLFQVTSSSVSSGNKVFVNAGIQFRTNDYDDPAQKRTRYSFTFLNVVMAEEIIGQSQ